MTALYSTGNQNLLLNRQYSAGLYLRFSKDDGKACDSTSIETQRMMLERYCQQNGLAIGDVYVDDGYTGLNFDRPDFQRLLGDIESGKINLVITKDLSRLGRDYIQTGHYIEIFFTERNVRYIAINDGVDTLNADNDIAPFKNILNDMYSKDISRKVKSAKHQRALRGLFIGPIAPYGYKKHPANKNQLIIDDEAAAVVREIFQMALSGQSGTAIYKSLTARQIPTPAAYKTAHGVTNYQRRTRNDGKWNYPTVMFILRERMYTGDMVNRKSEVANYKTKKVRKVAPASRIVVANTHEPIVSREDFDRVQQLVAERHRPRKHNNDNIFRRLVFCSECGKRMVLANQHIKTKGKGLAVRSVFRCGNHYKNPDECRHHNTIYYEDLYAQIWARVQKAIAALLSDDGILKAVQKRTDDKRADKKLPDEKAKTEKRLAALATIVRRLYEDYALELIDLDNYRNMLVDYQQQQKALRERLTAIDKELGKVDDVDENYRKLKTLAAAYADSTELTAEMLNKLIERIEITHPQKIDGELTQQITIIYRFIQTNLN